VQQPLNVTRRPTWYARTPFYYGWGIVSSAFLMNLIATGVLLWALSVLVVPMADDLGWQRGDFFIALTVRSIITAFLTPFFGHYIDRRHGGMLLLLSGGVLGAIAAAGVSTVHAPWQFMFWFGLVGGLAGPGAAYVVSAAIVPKWFVRKRGRALALSTMGTGAGALVMPLVATGLISAVGWRDTWVVLGVATAVITVPLALLMRRQPEDVGLLPDSDRAFDSDTGAPRSVAEEEYSFSASEALRQPTTWLIVTAMTLASMSLLGVPSNLVPMLQDRGMSLEGAATGLTIYGLMSMLARFSWGILAERTHVRKAILILSGYAAIVTFLFVVAGNGSAILFILAAGTGFGVGGIVILNPLVWPTYLGRRHLGAILGFVLPITTIGGSTGPFMMAKIFDWTGSYELGLVVLSGAWVLCGVAMYFARPFARTAPVAT